MDEKLPRKSYSSIINATTQIFKQHALSLIAIVGIVQIISYLVYPMLGFHSMAEQIATPGNLSSENIMAFAGSFGMFLALDALLKTAMLAMGLYFLWQKPEQQQLTIWTSSKILVEKWLSLVVAAVLIHLMILAGAMLFIVPALIMMVFLWVVFPAIVIDDETLADAFAKAFHYISKQFLHSAGLLILFLCGSIVLWMLLNTIGSYLPQPMVQIFDIVSMTLIFSFGICLMYIYYNELKRLHPTPLR